MPRESLIMFAVAAVFGLAGLWLLLQLRRPQGPARVYVYRMAGIMMVAGGIVLGFSAYAMWQWSAQP
ncbi:hypothetical protein DC429_08265 [Arthrobacter sp. TPD3018]|uniref:hypothetical protein n=1 Tax=Bacteria TaxID=2 RepID=UPI000D50A653|nr:MULTISPECIES: hypothetical protein [Bacteria]PVE58089.1 hypothetical protein DC425_09745 [Sphingomonas sp. TPD3009]PVE58307.1 hypothetical protein DC429_08265 [Arthrobacter sp. TPD3018]PVE87938.1 hypothetical protein DC431_04920 [Sphingomonas melonis]